MKSTLAKLIGLIIIVIYMIASIFGRQSFSMFGPPPSSAAVCFHMALGILVYSGGLTYLSFGVYSFTQSVFKHKKSALRFDFSMIIIGLVLISLPSLFSVTC